MMKYEETEEDTKQRFITPALTRAGWSMHQIMMEYDLKRDKHRIKPNATQTEKVKPDPKRNRPDYILCRNLYQPLAVLEAKKRSKEASEGLDQAIEYAKTLDVPFAYSSNGESFVEFDLTTGLQREFPLIQFPSPDDLWERWCKARGLSTSQRSSLKNGLYYTDRKKEPRYYQMVAINKTVNAIIADQRKRLLLVMATGTGKTYTAFQIIHRLVKANVVKNVLYLADRNQLIDQTMVGDFQPFDKVLTKIKSGKIDPNYQIYFGLYQQLKGNEEGINDDGELLSEHFRQVPKDFFDLIVVDECHRGSAKEESSWRTILEYFDSAIQIGLTATPCEKERANNTEYFGQPIYTYTLKQGIEDGFLAPYRVRYVALDKDVTGWTPDEGDADENGVSIPQKKYTIEDFDRSIILKQRIKVVAQTITDYLKTIGRMSKTIVFCVNQRHALLLRDALRECNQDMMKDNPDYIVRMTADDEDGKRLYDDFISISEKYPVIVTTSKLLTTGADTKCVKLIVLDTLIRSMTEFKQIIGRGSRLNEDAGKTFFTILDFRKACLLFKDEAFDGSPDDIAPWGASDPEVKTKENKGTGVSDNSNETNEVSDKLEPTPQTVYVVNDVPVSQIGIQDSYLDENGKLVTAKFKDYTRRCILELFSSADEFIELWNGEREKKAIVNQLTENGVSFKELKEVMGAEFDEFDLILAIAFGATPLTRHERLSRVARERFLDKYQGIAREVLNRLLSIYAREGVCEIDSPEVLKRSVFKPFKGIPRIMEGFGGQEAYKKAIRDLESELYFVPSSNEQNNNAMSI